MTARRSVIKQASINELFYAFEGRAIKYDGDDVVLTRTDLHKQFRNGEKAYEANHVTRFMWANFLLSGEVRASYRSTVYYKVTVELNPDYTVKSGECNCARGVACHHMGALLHCAHHNLSVTDLECSWNAPKKPCDKNDGRTLPQLHPPKRTGFCALTSIPSEDTIKSLLSNIGKCEGFAGIKWIWSEEPVSNESSNCLAAAVPEMLPVLQSTHFQNSSPEDRLTILKEFFHLDFLDIYDIASRTCGQLDSQLWINARRHRITASIFGEVINCMKSGRSPSRTLLTKVAQSAAMKKKSTTTQRNPREPLRPFQWGIEHEDDGKKFFEEYTGLFLEPTGVWLHESGLLGASPDGLVSDGSILEVKCPWTLWHATSLYAGLRNAEEFDRQPKSKRLVFYHDAGGKMWYLCNEHPIYHQIQGQ